MRFRLVVVVAALLAVCWPVCGALARDSNDLGPQPPGQFDFYVLSLTWVPGFCAGHRDPEECSQDLGFRLHGLWPESLNGYPYDCSNEALPADVRAEYVGLFPSPGMIDHEWHAHGTCTGHAQEGLDFIAGELP